MTNEECIKKLKSIKKDYIKIISCEALDMAIKSLEEERPKGEWILDAGVRGIHKCSNCGQLISTLDIDVYNYCHGCGADMRKDENKALLTPDERSDILNAIECVLKEKGVNLEIMGYEDINGFTFDVSLIRRW